MAALKVKNLTFSYGGKRVLSDINFHVGSGEILALVGPNGSGKSTLLRCLNGFLRPERGAIFINGEDVRGKRRRWISQNVALLPQNLQAVHHVTVRELVSMGRSPHHHFGLISGEDDLRAIDAAIDFMDLHSLQHRWVDRISGGERQRAWLAMILAQDTEIVLLDEPITFLDLKYQWNLVEIIKQVRKQFKKTFVMVIHDINHAMTVADRFVVLKNGRIPAHNRGGDVFTSRLLKDVYDVNARVCHVDGLWRPLIVPEERKYILRGIRTC